MSIFIGTFVIADLVDGPSDFTTDGYWPAF